CNWDKSFCDLAVFKRRSLPSYESFIKIIEFFNCSADFLIGATEEPFTERTYRAMPPFQELFRSLLSQEKITQYALHKKTNFSYDNFANWLKGETQPYLDNLLRLARALDRSVDQLLGRIV
ncbi:MAG: helix-turn-helix transcriptional regulator, partial [Clostridia bacterium]|nr:helix-turn-helix transcriptional regulator [Clostridia bacterium]